MRCALALALGALLLAGAAPRAALAEGLDRSPRPAPRLAPPGTAPAPALVTSALVTSAPASASAISMTSPRPLPRPAGLTFGFDKPEGGAIAADAPDLTVQADKAFAVPRPQHRPKGLVLASANAADALIAPAPQTDDGRKKRSKKGAVCGDRAIRGEVLAPITSRVKGCGIAEPVRITEVDGLRLSQPATLDCDTATALHQWIDQGLRPAFGQAQVVELQIAASYVCRPRNNKKGGKISEHGRGRAIDVAGFVLADGTVWTIARDYNKTIRRAHRAACGIFGTTLGPGSDGYHEDHLHFDVARYRNGAYCR